VRRVVRLHRGRHGLARNVSPAELELRDADQPDLRGPTGWMTRSLDKLNRRGATRSRTSNC
jgi:hypothetical protein